MLTWRAKGAKFGYVITRYRDVYGPGHETYQWILESRVPISPISSRHTWHSSFRRLGECAKFSQQVLRLIRSCLAIVKRVLVGSVLICGKETSRDKRQGQGGAEAGRRMAVRCVLAARSVLGKCRGF